MCCCLAVAAAVACSGYARKYNGPDSPYAEFAADTCSAPLGLPSCAQWIPDDKFVLFRYLWEHIPRVSSASLGQVHCVICWPGASLSVAAKLYLCLRASN
jgi:hypothetical protein